MPILTSHVPVCAVIRADALTPAQETALQQLVSFVDAHLLTASNEKRGVALHLIILLVQRVPADCLPVALTAVRDIRTTIALLLVEEIHQVFRCVECVAMSKYQHALGTDCFAKMAEFFLS
jgi:hypothetical protein